MRNLFLTSVLMLILGACNNHVVQTAPPDATVQTDSSSSSNMGNGSQSSSQPGQSATTSTETTPQNSH